MIPPFDETGCLPPGIHPATLDEIDQAAFRELRIGLPFLDIAIAGRKRIERYVDRLFAADRHGVTKGLVEVLHDAPE